MLACSGCSSPPNQMGERGWEWRMLKVYGALLVGLISGLASMANAESAPLTLLVKGSERDLLNTL